MGKETCPGVGDHEEEKLQEFPDREKSICVSEEQTEEDCQTDDCNADDVEIGVDCEGETNTDVNYKATPESVKRRIMALRSLQVKIIDTDVKFNEKVFELKIQFEKLRRDLFEKRFKIINGEYEPTDEECDIPSLDDDQNYTKAENYPIYDENVKGIPEFWLTVFRNSSILSEIFQKHDEPLLFHLQDIKLKLHDSPTGYTLEFHFSENEYFTNKVLTKYYEISFKPDKAYPFGYDGTESTIDFEGCQIDWKEGKNITLKTEDEDYMKHVDKPLLCDSFFDFFNFPQLPEDDSDLEQNQNANELVDEDFELGKIFKDRIIPKATLYYTGEEFDDGDNYEEEDEGEEEEEEEDEKDEDKEDEKDEDKEEDKEEDKDEEDEDERDENNNIKFENKNIA